VLSAHGHLPSDSIRQIHRAVVQCGLLQQEKALLCGIDPSLIGSIPTEGIPNARLLAVLDVLNHVEDVGPLKCWLRNAITLSEARPEAGVFERALEELAILRDETLPHNVDEFVARVTRVCQLRNPGASIRRRPAPKPFSGVLLVSIEEDRYITQYPIGVLNQSITLGALDQFIAEVERPYRQQDPYLRSFLVHTGAGAPDELFRHAGSRAVRLMSFSEYQNLVDFTRYLQWQTRRLENDNIYPPSLYVPQRAQMSVAGQPWVDTADVITTLQEMLVTPHPRFAVVLGDFGAGKTFLLHELARRMAIEGGPLIPVLVEMRALEKQSQLNALLAQHFAIADVGRCGSPTIARSTTSTRSSRPLTATRRW
jgi:hypothetical protein